MRNANRRKSTQRRIQGGPCDGRCWLLVPIKGCALFPFKQKKGEGESTCYREAPVSGVLIDDVFLMAHIIASVLPLPFVLVDGYLCFQHDCVDEGGWQHEQVCYSNNNSSVETLCNRVLAARERSILASLQTRTRRT